MTAYLGLPELNGYKIFRAIDAAAKGKLPIVILTSDNRSASENSADLTLPPHGSGHVVWQNPVHAGGQNQFAISYGAFLRIGLAIPHANKRYASHEHHLAGRDRSPILAAWQRLRNSGTSYGVG
jgi:hypothetical protein